MQFDRPNEAAGAVNKTPEAHRAERDGARPAIPPARPQSGWALKGMPEAHSGQRTGRGRNPASPTSSFRFGDRLRREPPQNLHGRAEQTDGCAAL